MVWWSKVVKPKAHWSSLLWQQQTPSFLWFATTKICFCPLWPWWSLLHLGYRLKEQPLLTAYISCGKGLLLKHGIHFHSINQGKIRRGDRAVYFSSQRSHWKSMAMDRKCKTSIGRKSEELRAMIWSYPIPPPNFSVLLELKKYQNISHTTLEGKKGERKHVECCCSFLKQGERNQGHRMRVDVTSPFMHFRR